MLKSGYDPKEIRKYMSSQFGNLAHVVRKCKYHMKFCPIYYFMIFDGEIRHVIMEMISYLFNHYFPVVVHHFPNCRAFLAIKEASSSVIHGPIGMHIACSEK